jgi:hypothetical protein
MNTRASILSALTVSLITLFVAAAPQRARAQATIFTLTDVVFDDGTKATGHFIVANGAIQSFDIETLAVGKGTGGIIYCNVGNSSSSSCGAYPGAMGALGPTFARDAPSSPASPVNSSVYFFSPFGSVLTLTSPGNTFTTPTPLPYGATKIFSLCAQGKPLPNNTCYTPYGYPWVGGPEGKYLADFLSNEVFFPTFVSGLGYRQAAGRGVVSGTLSGCGALLGLNGLACEPPSGAQKTTAPK